MASSSYLQGSNPAISNSTAPFTSSSTDVVPNPNTSSSAAIASPPDVPPPLVAPSTAPVPPPDVPSLSTSGRKKSKGRGKIEMRKMEKESNMLVTFSKRKSNLLKKANELCTLCGVECAIVVFSPAGKVFSFGHPSVDQVTDRYLNGILNPIPPPPPPNKVPQNPSEGQHQAGTDIVQTLSAELSKLTSLLEASKKHGQALDERRAARMATNWWERPVADINNAAQLDALRDAMLNLRGKVYTQAGLRIQASASSSSVPAPFAGYNSYPDFAGAGPTTGPLSGGFLGGNYNFGPNEAGPSG